MGTCIEIVDWDIHYENYRTRELKKMAWVPMPNRHDGDGYTRLMDHPNGAAHFGAWCALVEVASRCESAIDTGNGTGRYRDSGKYDNSKHPHGRGLLMRKNGEPHDAISLERMTRVPVSIWDEVLERLVTIGWIRYCEISVLATDEVPTHYRDGTDDIGSKPWHDAGEHRMNGTEMNGNERKGESSQSTSNHQAPPVSASPPEPQEKEVSTKVDNRIPEESMPIMFELQEIYRRVTHGETLKLSDGEMSALLELFRRHDGPSVVAAYKLHQAKKPGKAFEYFLQDFPEYIAKAPRPAAPPPLHCDHCGADVDAKGKGHTATCNRPGNGNGLPAPTKEAGDNVDVF